MLLLPSNYQSALPSPHYLRHLPVYCLSSPNPFLFVCFGTQNLDSVNISSLSDGLTLGFVSRVLKGHCKAIGRRGASFLFPVCCCSVGCGFQWTNVQDAQGHSAALVDHPAGCTVDWLQPIETLRQVSPPRGGHLHRRLWMCTLKKSESQFWRGEGCLLCSKFLFALPQPLSGGTWTDLGQQ